MHQLLSTPMNLLGLTRSFTIALTTCGALVAVGCSAPAVSSFKNPNSDDLELNPSKNGDKNDKNDKNDETPEAETETETEDDPPTSVTPPPDTNDPCISCIGQQSPAAARYQECAFKCGATDINCDNACWSQHGCASQEDACATALNSCETTCGT